MMRGRAVIRGALMMLALLVLVPNEARADVALPTIAIVFGSPWWLIVGLGAVIAIESLVLWARLALVGLALGQALAVTSVANLVSTLIGIPLAWLALVVLFGLAGGTDHDIRTSAGRRREALWLAPWVMPHDYVDWDRYSGEWDWIYPVKLLVLLPPFFVVSWLIERGVAGRMLERFGGELGGGVLLGNVATYALLALIVLGWLLRELRRASPGMAQTRVAEEQLRELRELEARAQAAFEAGDFNGLYAVQGRLHRLRGYLVDERSAALADRTRDVCRAQLDRLRAERGLSGRRPGQRADAGWADGNGNRDVWRGARSPVRRPTE
ncbi:MAG: hypothetical protein JSW46_00710 [Gemmatimonadota bacterium]|nr:MAG: hypothetical protein JSW46_00710 [Gemmatimonadota bacterium]